MKKIIYLFSTILFFSSVNGIVKIIHDSRINNETVIKLNLNKSDVNNKDDLNYNTKNALIL